MVKGESFVGKPMFIISVFSEEFLEYCEGIWFEKGPFNSNDVLSENV